MQIQSSPWTLANPLREEKLTDRMSLGGDGMVTFHWSDFSEACAIWQERVKREPGLRADFERRRQETARLAQMPLWLRAGHKVTQTNLHDLYDTHIRELARHRQDLLPPLEVEVSFVAPAGPYKLMRLTDCFNQRTYQNMVMVRLLEERLPRRHFRLRFDGCLLAEYGEGLRDAGVVRIEQITTEGVVCRAPADTIFSGMGATGTVRIMLNSAPLRAAVAAPTLREGLMGWGANALYTHDKSASFVVQCARLSLSDTLTDGDAHFFIPHSEIAASNPDMVRDLRAFVARGEETVRAMLKAPRAA
jgi:hypothetical protein